MHSYARADLDNVVVDEVTLGNGPRVFIAVNDVFEVASRVLRRRGG